MVGMEETPSSDTSQQKVVKSGSGLTKAGLPLVRHRVQRPTDSRLDWLKRLWELRRKLLRGALFRDVELPEEVPRKTHDDRLPGDDTREAQRTMLEISSSIFQGKACHPF
jgi:hypothetical protein